MEKCGPGSKAGRTALATCGPSSAPGPARSSRGAGQVVARPREDRWDPGGNNPRFGARWRGGKRRRVTRQPLSGLPVEIKKGALTSDKQQYWFARPLGDQPMNRKVMATALRG